MDFHFAASVRSVHLKGDHDCRDDLVADLRSFLHVTDSDVDGVPGSALDLIGWVHDLLDEEAGVESLLFCIVEVNR